MIIGNGMLAKAFAHYKTDNDILIFASGVSNSKDVSEKSYDRERKLLQETILRYADKKIIYFSTGSILDEEQINSFYVKHKLRMEELIVKQCAQFTIFRLTNPIGKTNNKHTILNYLSNQIKTETKFTVWKNAKRNLMDLDDVITVCNYIIHDKMYHNNTVTIANLNNYKVIDIVMILEKYLGKKALFSLEDKGGVPQIKQPELKNMYEKLSIQFNEDYLENILKKYF